MFSYTLTPTHPSVSEFLASPFSAPNWESQIFRAYLYMALTAKKILLDFNFGGLYEENHRFGGKVPNRN